MATSVRYLLITFLNIAVVHLAGLSPLVESPCGNWIPYKNEQCLKLVTTTGLQSKKDAVIFCQSFAEELQTEFEPQLLTVKTEEKQKFLHKWLFNQLDTLENVWLGLDLDEDEIFRWNNETDLFYTNWDEKLSKESMADKERNCVEMESGEGGHDTGKWTRANCMKRNVVVCERDQPATLAALQNTLLSLKLEIEKNKQIAEQERNEAKEEIENLKRNPVPMGFIYSQLPDQDDPMTIWPETNWTDVSSSYAGLFFRVTGGNAASFGQTQGDSSPRLSAVEMKRNGNWGGPYYTDVPRGGGWSGYVFSGDHDGFGDLNMRFHMAGGEVRPRNKAMVIWKRIG